MKIIFLIKAFALKAGVERLMSDKMNYMAEQGHNIILVTYEQGVHPAVYPLHPTIKHIDIDTRFFTLKKYSLPRRIIEIFKLQKLFKKRFQKVVNEFQPDIIHTTTYSLSLIKILLRLKTNAKKTIESQVSFESVMKGTDFEGHGILEIIAKRYDAYILKYIKNFDAFFTLTKGDTEKWKKYTNNIIVIPNPLTLYPKEVNSHDKTLHRIICAGRLDKQKGFDLLIDAFAPIALKCPDWHIDIFGSGDDYNKLTQQIKERDVETQIFIHPATNQIYDEFQNSDFFVFSSRFEGWGLVIVEAMSCGIPVVSFKCDYGPEDIISDHEDGILVTNGDIAELGEKILWMINHPEERLKMGAKARLTAKKYQKEIISQQWINVFKSLIEN